MAKYFYFHTTIMMIFLFFFSFYVIGLFFTSSDIDSKCLTGNSTEPEYPILFHGCSGMMSFSFWLLCELGLCSTTVLFLLVEVFQMTRRGRGYCKDLENWIQLMIIICAAIAMATKHILLREKDTHAEIIRSLEALGLLSAFFEVILIVGRYPFRGSDFSIMFYKVLKKIAFYTVALIVVIMGFSSSFAILQYGTCSAENDCNRENAGFASSWKAFVRTLTIALGEFNFEDAIYNRFNNSEQYISRAVSLVILVIMIFTVTITLVNLFIAVIISDRRDLKISVFKENLIYMAENIQLAESILPRKWREKLYDEMLDEEFITVCVHNLCGPGCEAKKIPTSARLIKPKLLKIIKYQMANNYKEANDGKDIVFYDKPSFLLRESTLGD